MTDRQYTQIFEKRHCFWKYIKNLRNYYSKIQPFSASFGLKRKFYDLSRFRTQNCPVTVWLAKKFSRCRGNRKNYQHCLESRPGHHRPIKHALLTLLRTPPAISGGIPRFFCQILMRVIHFQKATKKVTSSETKPCYGLETKGESPLFRQFPSYT